MQEKMIEKKLVNMIKNEGGLALKFTSDYFTGVPDRMALMPGGKIYFVELKATGKKQSPIQLEVAKKFEALGFPVRVIDSLEGVRRFVEEISVAGVQLYREPFLEGNCPAGNFSVEVSGGSCVGAGLQMCEVCANYSKDLSNDI